MRAELKTDIYNGKNCDEHKNYWNVYAEGDKQDDNVSEDLTLALSLPVGTKVIVMAPECPRCHLTQEDCGCGFNWKEWIEEEYS